MFKKFLALVLTLLIINLFFINTAFAQIADNEDILSRNVKNTVAKIGTEPNRKLKVTLKDGTKLKGYITEIKNDHFDVLDTRTSKVTTIQYSNVKEAKRDGLSQMAKGWIAGGVLLGTLLTIVFVGVTRESF